MNTYVRPYRKHIKCVSVSLRFVTQMLLLCITGVALGQELSTTPVEKGFVLTKSDVIVVDFNQNGCYFAGHWMLKYSPSPTPNLDVTSVAMRRERNSVSNKMVNVTRRKHLSIVTLTDDQVVLLGNFIDHYYANPKTESTTSVKMRTSVERNGKVVQFLQRENGMDYKMNILSDADPDDLRVAGISGKPVLSLVNLCVAAEYAYRQGIKVTPYTPLPREKSVAFRIAERKRQQHP